MYDTKQQLFDELCKRMRKQGRLGVRERLYCDGLCCAAGIFVPEDELHLVAEKSYSYRRPDGDHWTMFDAHNTKEGWVDCVNLHDTWKDREDVEGFLKAVAEKNGVNYE